MTTKPNPRVAVGEEDLLEVEPAEYETELDPAEYEAPAPATSMLPVVLSVVAGLVVVGLMAAIMLTPRNSSGSQGATGAGAAITVQSAPGAGGATLGGVIPTLGAVHMEEKLQVGYLAPDFNLSRVDGGKVQLSSYRGKQPVWVNIWATWCPPCRGEMPEMEKIYQSYQGQGLEILGVDYQESQKQVKDFVTQGGYHWNFLNDFDGNVGIKYHASSIPTHVFVGRDGIIRYITIGGISRANMDIAVSAILAP